MTEQTMEARATEEKETLEMNVRANKHSLKRDLERLISDISHINDYLEIDGFSEVAFRLVQVSTAANYAALRASEAHHQKLAVASLGVILKTKK